MSEKLYAHRDVIALNRNGNIYCRHVEAMTAEALHEKSDIAAELAHRDVEIERLQAENKRLRALIWNLRPYVYGLERITDIDAAMEVK